MLKPQKSRRSLSDWHVLRRTVVMALGLVLWIGLAARPGVALDAAPADTFNPDSGVLGNKAGSVKLIELFDYNCGPCRHVFPDMLDLVATNPRLKIVLIDFPILGSDSRDVARVAVAARMQDATGEKFLAFHRNLMSHYGPNDGGRAIEAAQAAGFDMRRLAHDMQGPDVEKVLQATMAFAKTAGVDATPSFVMDGHVFAGEDGFHELRYKIEDLPPEKLPK